MNDVLLIVLLVAPLIDWATVVMLASISRGASGVRSLRERLLVATAIAIGTTIIAFLAINSRWLHLSLPVDLPVIALVAGIVAPSAVNALWLYRGWRGEL